MLNRRLLSLARGAERPMVACIALGLAITATYAGQGFAIAEVLARIFDGEPLGSTAGLLMVILVLQGVRAGLLWLREVAAMAAGGAVKLKLRRRLYEHLLDLGPGYTVRTRTGHVLTAMVDNVEGIDKYYGQFLPQVVSSLVGAVALVAYIVSIDPAVGLVVAVCALIVPVAPQLSRRWWKRASTRWTALYRALFANSLDAIQGMTTLKAFNAHQRRGEELHAESEEFNRASTGLLMTASISAGVVGLADSAGTALAVGIGALRLADGALTIGQLLIVLVLTRECFRPLNDLQHAYHAAYSAPAAAVGIFELLDARPDRQPTTAGVASEDPDPARTAPAVVFDGVTFGYRDDAAPALDAVSFRIEPGETVALVGRSGGGKTTAVSLLLRFFDPASGAITIGGRDLRDLPVDELRRLVAVVAQDTYLFHGTVRRNLLVGRTDASDADLEEAALAARAHEFIAALPEGYDTVIGERGLRLSGGERQRLAIARALLKDAPVLVLDEATSAIDGASESAIQAALATLTVGRTTLVVAHRLSTVRSADRIVVLDGGRQIETGAPAELLEQPGAYARLVTAQASS